MDDDELLAAIARAGGYPRAFQIWTRHLLRKLEEIVWQWHAERRYEHFTGPLFFAGGPPPYHFAVDWTENNARSRQLTPRQRSLWGPGNTYIRALQRRLYMLAADGRDGGADAVRAWRRMWQWYEIFADGREMQMQMRFSAFAMAFSPGTGLRAGAARAAPARPALRTPSAPAPAASARVPSSTPTLPGIGPDIGHAQTLPALPPVAPRRTLPGLGPGASAPSGPTTGNTLPGIGPGGAQSPIPPMPARRPAGGGTGSNEMRAMTEEVGGCAATGNRQGPSRPAGLVPPGGRVERLTEQQRLTLNDNYARGDDMVGVGFNNYPRTPGGTEAYMADLARYGLRWSHYPHGFIVRNADGSPHRIVGYGRGTLRR
jgi:hypothetical protein